MRKNSRKKLVDRSSQPDGRNQSTAGFAAGQLGAVYATGEAEASDAMRHGMDLLRHAAEQLGDSPQRHGNLFEYIAAAEFNAQAARAGSDLEAVVTAAEGDPHAAADIIIKRGEDIVEKIQAKAYKGEARAAAALSRPKYDGFQKLVPDGKARGVQDWAEKGAKRHKHPDSYADTAKNVTDRMKAEGIESNAPSYEDSIFAKNHPDLYATMAEVRQVAAEAGYAGVAGAAAGGIIGAAISATKNGVLAYSGKQSACDALAKTGNDAGKAAARGGGAGALGAAIRHGAYKGGLRGLAKASAATTALASATIDAGVTVFEFATGKVNGQQAAEQLGQNGTSTISGIYTGMVVGLTFGPVGAVVGSIAGYMLASGIYQASITLFRRANLAKEEAARVLVLCEEACLEMERQRVEFLSYIDDNLSKRKQDISKSLTDLDAAMSTRCTLDILERLSAFVCILGTELNLVDRKQLDSLMAGSSPLRL